VPRLRAGKNQLSYAHTQACTEDRTVPPILWRCTSPATATLTVMWHTQRPCTEVFVKTCVVLKYVDDDDDDYLWVSVQDKVTFVKYSCYPLTFETPTVCSRDHSATTVLLRTISQCYSITPTTSATVPCTPIPHLHHVTLLAKWSSIKGTKRVVNTKKLNTQDGAWRQQKRRVRRSIPDVRHSSTVAAQTLEADHVLDLTSSYCHLLTLSVKADAVTASDPRLNTVHQLDGQLAAACNTTHTQTNLCHRCNIAAHSAPPLFAGAPPVGCRWRRGWKRMK